MLNKYYPPDFDPSKIPRRKKPKDKQEIIRLMAPFSMRCNTCGEYIYAGKKFNGRKETVQGQEYYGLKIFRFYIKCPMCSSEITFKTDPKNRDYAVEHGVTRNFEPWREGKQQDEDDSADPLAHIIAEEGLEVSDEDPDDPMKALEKRQQESRREMEVMDALQDIRTRNARLERVDTADVLQRLEQKGKAKLTAEEQEQQALEDEDERLVQRYFGRDMAASASDKKAEASESPASRSPETPTEGNASTADHGISIKRLRSNDEDEADLGGTRSTLSSAQEPDIRSVLSERAREQLLSATTAKTSSQTPVAATFTASKVGSAPPSKRKKQANAFGLVRKKV